MALLEAERTLEDAPRRPVPVEFENAVSVHAFFSNWAKACLVQSVSTGVLPCI